MEASKSILLRVYSAIGFRVRSKWGTQFRIWANRNLKEYMVKGFVMDDEPLKNPDGRPDYFDELLERIRNIRASEKRFYQKLRDLFALSSDYDPTDKAAQMFVVIFLETAAERALAACANRVRVPIPHVQRSRTRLRRMRSYRVLGAQLARVPA